MNKQKTVAETIPYEAPQMQVVPIRCSGAMLLVGSSPTPDPMMQYEFESSFGSKFQEAYDDGFSTNESFETPDGWGDSFF